MSRPVTILIVDDHTMMLNALKSLLPHDSTIKVVGTASSGPEAEKLYKELLPDVVVMDIYMKPVTGIETTQNILKKFPDAKILGLSNAWSTEDSNQLATVGGRGYIVKTSPLDAIVNCIKKVNAGELCFTEDDFKV
ncbi:MAG: response regulator transcription factor [Chitinophagaceae bacterium]